MRNALIAIAGIALCVTLAAAIGQAGQAGAEAALLPASSASAWDGEASTFLSLINNYRAQSGLRALAVDTSLENASSWMSADMLSHCVAGRSACSHTDSTGRAWDQRLRDFGYPAGVSAGAAENIAWGWGGGMTTAQQAFTAWRNSSGHNANMLNGSYAAIGIARVCNGGDCAWVTDFGTKLLTPFGTGSTTTPTPTSTPAPTRTPVPTTTPIATATPPSPLPATNLALGRYAWASSNAAGSAARSAVDGSLSTAWQSATGGRQWLAVDLGKTTPISKITVRWGAAYANAYQVEFSNNRYIWTRAWATSNGTGAETITLGGSARYVRVRTTARLDLTKYQLSELQVFGPGTP